MYVLKLEGHTVRMFDDKIKAVKWAEKHCKGEWCVRRLVETRMPRAMKLRWDDRDLRHKPFVSVVQ